uniref:RGS domain-containing protein n=1 Tax=Panagrellus redivivus TaxID=6233 RepID=A0A7E4W4D2_PANRE
MLCFPRRRSRPLPPSEDVPNTSKAQTFPPQSNPPSPPPPIDTREQEAVSPVAESTSTPTPHTSPERTLQVTSPRVVRTPPPPKPKALPIPHDMQALFDKNAMGANPAPEMPSTNGIDYPRAASWSSSTVADIMADKIGRQVFRCFLFQALAEENMLFVEQLDEIKKINDPEKLKQNVTELMEKYDMYINISSVAKAKLKEIMDGNPDKRLLEPAHKEISKLLENDQFPRFRRSELYLSFLEQLLPRAYAEKWAYSFDALLGNQVGRHHFREFLHSIHAEENLRFWEAIIEFRNTRNKSQAMQNMARSIHDQFLKEGCSNEVFLPFGLRQNLIKRIKDKDVDLTLFDEATKHVENVLKNDPYVRFLQSNNYKQLLEKLH